MIWQSHHPSGAWCLPPAPSRLLGRSEQLRQITDAVNAGAQIVQLCGPPGIGTTALAVHWVTQARSHGRYPDGALYAPLRSNDDTPYTDPYQSVLPSLLRALGTAPGQVPVRPDRMRSHFAVLSGSLSLVVVCDDAQVARQVLPFLPSGPRSLCLVTCADPLLGFHNHPAHQVQVPPLDPEAAAELLHRAAPRLNPGSRANHDLVQHCAGLPLALAVHAARAATRPARDHHAPVTARPGQSPADVFAHLDQAYATLSPALRTLYQLLGLYPTPVISAAAIEALAGAAVRRATAKAVSALVARQLITVLGEETYRISGTVRAHMRDLATRLDSPARRAATEALVDYCLASVRSCLALLAPHWPTPPPAYASSPPVAEPLPDAEAALRWLDTHHDMIIAVQRLAAEIGLLDAAVQLADAARIILPSLGHTPAWRASQHEALHYAPLVHPRQGQRAQVRLLATEGEVLCRNGEPYRALTVLEQAWSLCPGEDTLGQAWIHHVRALAHRLVGHDEAADSDLRWACRLCPCVEPHQQGPSPYGEGPAPYAATVRWPCQALMWHQHASALYHAGHPGLGLQVVRQLLSSYLRWDSKARRRPTAGPTCTCHNAAASWPSASSSPPTGPTTP